MVTGALAVKAPRSTDWAVPPEPLGEPATYIVVPFTVATRAELRLTVRVMEFELNVNSEIPAWIPPHSGPQLTTYAVLSSVEKNAATGRENVAVNATGAGVVADRSISMTVSVVSLITNSLFPAWFKASQRAAGT